MKPRYLILDVSYVRSVANHSNGSLSLYRMTFSELIRVLIESLTDTNAQYQLGDEGSDYGLLYRGLYNYNSQNRKEFTMEDIHDVCKIGLNVYKYIYPTILNHFSRYPFTKLVVNECIGDDVYVDCY